MPIKSSIICHLDRSLDNCLIWLPFFSGPRPCTYLVVHPQFTVHFTRRSEGDCPTVPSFPCGTAPPTWYLDSNLSPACDSVVTLCGELALCPPHSAHCIYFILFYFSCCYDKWWKRSRELQVGEPFAALLCCLRSSSFVGGGPDAWTQYHAHGNMCCFIFFLIPRHVLE